MRYALHVEYQGGAYQGWQIQPTGDTVQKYVDHALSQVANHAVKTTCAGRTDAGVHGLGQVVHFDSSSTRSKRDWLGGVNQYLPGDIAVHNIVQVADDFDARRHALSRSYRYLILNSPTPSALMMPGCWWTRRTLKLSHMKKAAKLLLGEHDFSAFRASQCQSKTTRRDIKRLRLVHDDAWIIVDVTANAFLHNMVRIIVGTLMDIGLERFDITHISSLLESGDRTQAGVTAPAKGLYFRRVEYPRAAGVNFAPVMRKPMLSYPLV